MSWFARFTLASTKRLASSASVLSSIASYAASYPKYGGKSGARNFQIRDAARPTQVALSADFAPSSSPKKMTSFPDENISSINRTSDFNGFEGLRVVVWQSVKGRRS
jgi:hypothetical protein